jgi:hypothetical protein
VFFSDTNPCPHQPPPGRCPACAKLRDTLVRLEKVANTIRIAAGTHDPETCLQLLRRAFALAAGQAEEGRWQAGRK